ncbi:MAG: hypothetical protein AB2600_09000, partial [Candidatus Thiodiazotropha sp.]
VSLNARAIALSLSAKHNVFIYMLACNRNKRNIRNKRNACVSKRMDRYVIHGFYLETSRTDKWKTKDNLNG